MGIQLTVMAYYASIIDTDITTPASRIHSALDRDGNGMLEVTTNSFTFKCIGYCICTTIYRLLTNRYTTLKVCNDKSDNKPTVTVLLFNLHF